MIAATPVIHGSRADLRIDVAGDGSTHTVHWALPPGVVPDAPGAADAVLTATLLPAMARSEPLALGAPISPRLADAVDTIQAVFETWARHSEQRHGLSPVFRTVPVDRSVRDGPTGDRPPRRACFFSGGVDSLATALAHRDEDVTLVFVHGLDVPLGDRALRERAIGFARQAAAGLGLPLIEVETSVRPFTDVYVDWLDAHGAALGGVASLLAPQFGRVYVPSSSTYATLVPLGSHPLVDPLWSSERVEVVHDGCEWTRVDKVRAIAAEPAARETLRVCVQTDVDELNCGRCWKCLNTIGAIRALDMGASFPTMPRLSDAEFVRRMALVPGASTRTPSWERLRNEWVPFVAVAQPEQRRIIQGALVLRYSYGVGRFVARRTRTRLGRRSES